MTIESLSGCFHKAGGLSQELSTTSNVNLFPPFCKPRVYTGLAPGPGFSWQWLVVTHTWGGVLKWFLCLIRGGCGSFESFSSVYLPTSICGPGLSPGARGGDPSLIPKVCYGFGGNVLCLRSGLDQVAVPPPKAYVAFGLSVWIADGNTCPQELVLMKFLFAYQ